MLIDAAAVLQRSTGLETKLMLHLLTMAMNADVLTTRVADGIAVITLAGRIYLDEEMGDTLTEALEGFTGVVTGVAPGCFIRHFSVAALIRVTESAIVLKE